jgi:tetratricopeptide (TPR) repeat protein
VKRLVSLIVAITALFAVQAQSYPDQFNEALDRNDLKAQRAILADWQLAAPTDIDLYIARWNYYVNDYMGEDQTGYLSTRDQAIVDSGFAVIDEAIERYPERLELRFGKIYFLGQIMRWDGFVEEILRTLDYSQQIVHKWTFNELTGQGRQLMSEGMQDYLFDMFETIDNLENLTAEDSVMVGRIRLVAHRTIQVFPNDVAAMNMLAVSYMLLNDNDNAVKHLLRAEKIQPNNPDVLSNLIQAYTRLGKSKEAKIYQARLDSLQ